MQLRPDARPIAAEQSRSNRLKGIVLICCAVTCFSGLDASAKYLTANTGLPTLQVVWIRFFGQLVVILAMIGLVNVPRLLRTRKPWHQGLRSCLLLVSTTLNFFALLTLRLDQTTTIQFLAPLLVALLAGPILGEWVGWRRMIAIFVGFAGILVVVRPGFATFEFGMLLAFGSMLGYAGFILLTRYLSAHDSPEVTIFYSLLAGTAVMAPVAIDNWVWPQESWMWLLLASLGLWAGLGHYLFILAHRLAPAPIVAPFMYSQLLSMVVLGYVIFNDVPDVWTLAGASIVIASGIYLIYREQKVKAIRD